MFTSIWKLSVSQSKDREDVDQGWEWTQNKDWSQIMERSGICQILEADVDIDQGLEWTQIKDRSQIMERSGHKLGTCHTLGAEVDIYQDGGHGIRMWEPISDVSWNSVLHISKVALVQLTFLNFPDILFKCSNLCSILQ